MITHFIISLHVLIMFSKFSSYFFSLFCAGKAFTVCGCGATCDGKTLCLSRSSDGKNPPKIEHLTTPTRCINNIKKYIKKKHKKSYHLKSQIIYISHAPLTAKIPPRSSILQAHAWVRKVLRVNKQI